MAETTMFCCYPSDFGAGPDDLFHLHARGVLIVITETVAFSFVGTLPAALPFASIPTRSSPSPVTVIGSLRAASLRHPCIGRNNVTSVHVGNINCFIDKQIVVTGFLPRRAGTFTSTKEFRKLAVRSDMV